MKKRTGTTAENLANVLSDEIALYEKYRDQLKNDQTLMTSLKIEELEESNKAKATLLLKIQTLDQARHQLVTQIAKERGLAEEKVRVRDICEKLSRDESQMIMNLRSRLISTIESIRSIQEEAQVFVQSSLTWMDGSMRQLRNLLSPAGVYNAQGRVGKPQNFSGHVLENKA